MIPWIDSCGISGIPSSFLLIQTLGTKTAWYSPYLYTALSTSALPGERQASWRLPYV